MRITTPRLLALASSLTAAAALAAPAAPAASATPAPSAVTIAPYVKGLFGYVTSKAGSRCAAGRRVEVFAQADPGSKAPDRRLGTAVARRVEDRSPSTREDYMWRLTKRRPGRFYARVAPRQGCAGARSAAVEGLGGPRDGAGDPPIPPCPSAGRYCRLDQLHFDTGLCPSFTAYAATCGGSISGPPEWRTGGGHFDWAFVQGGFRKVILYATSYRDSSEMEWRLLGFMGGPEQAEWTVTEGFNKRGAYADAEWYVPEAAGKAGSLGGPLYLDFRNGILGADVYVRGYLFRR